MRPAAITLCALSAMVFLRGSRVSCTSLTMSRHRKTHKHNIERCTHLGLALNAFFTAQRWLVSLLLLPMLLIVSLSAPIGARGRLGIIHAAETRAPAARRSGMRCDTGLVVWLHANALCEVTGGNKGWMYFQRPRKRGGDALRRSLGVINARSRTPQSSAL